MRASPSRCVGSRMKSMKSAPAWNAAFALTVLGIFKSATRSSATRSNGSSKNSDFFINGFLMPSLRLQRVRELLKREIGEVIRREIPVGEAGLITVNDVNVSGDLREATVYISILGNPVQQSSAPPHLPRQPNPTQGPVVQ